MSATWLNSSEGICHHDNMHQPQILRNKCRARLITVSFCQKMRVLARQSTQFLGSHLARSHFPSYLCRQRCRVTSAANTSSVSMDTYSACRQLVLQQVVLKDPPESPIQIHTVSNLESSPVSQPAKNWARVNSFEAKPGEVLAVPDPSGSLECVLLGIGDAKPSQAIWAYAALPGKLPAGTYRLTDDAPFPEQALLGWCLGE
jgi:hypothetical protein